jgi:hypothetical protein
VVSTQSTTRYHRRLFFFFFFFVCKFYKLKRRSKHGRAKTDKRHADAYLSRIEQLTLWYQ